VQVFPVIGAETLPNLQSFSILGEVKLQIILLAFYAVLTSFRRLTKSRKTKTVAI